MNLTKENKKGFCILKVEGRIDTTNFHEFEKELFGVIGSGETNIILNCNRLNYISSSGLMVFHVAQLKLTELKGILYLCEMQPPIKEIFNISGFSTIFKIFETEEEATA